MLSLQDKVSPQVDQEFVATAAEAMREELSKAIVGQDAAVEALIVALFAGGHTLLEGVPGLAKTLLVRSLARVVDGEYSRVQFTPDLMPSDITGNLVFDPRSAEFHMRKGPIFTNVLLADEINRTPPKTQSALLEAMEEGHVTIAGRSERLPDPFVVVATQNPVEYEGTYPLPEAQMDRFLFKITLTYPSEAEERNVLQYSLGRVGLASTAALSLKAVITPQQIVAGRHAVTQVVVSESVLDYALRLVRSTREHPRVYLGASPRGAVMLVRAAQAMAATSGRTFVVPDDVQQMADGVLRHRLILHPEAEIEGMTADHVVQELIEQIEVPR